MTIITRNEYSKNDFYNLYDNSWSGALQTLDDIKNADLEEEATTLNDYIWFERDEIYEALGLDENGELPKEDEE